MAQLRSGAQRWYREMNGNLKERASVLFDLLPHRPGGWVPCFLLDEPTASGWDEVAERLARTPVSRLAADLSGVVSSKKNTRWVRELANGVTQARQVLVDDLHGYFSSSLTPLWPQIQAAAVTDRELRSETLLRSGAEALLATLGAGLRWQPPTLHIPAPFTADISLEGRGLVLMPSYFTLRPTRSVRPGQPSALIYPMYTGDRPNGTLDALGRLLGYTRAAVLVALRVPATTTALADRAGISLSSASQHTAALRNAGLITTTRRGITVLHTLTPLGAALLHG